MYVVAQPQAAVQRPVPFELLLFSTDTDFVARAASAGVDGFIVDWEYRGKERRQAGADTQINRDTLVDLRRVRAATQRRVICRINGWGSTTAREVEQAIDGGVDEILLPMVRGAAEVERVLELVRGRCGLGILVETLPAARHITSFGRLPLSRVYVGLNDLAIARRTANIFVPLVDGTLEHVRRQV
ncbi:MAG TPA: aldolase/citrate lyase family protein, partial [Herpetosiphonaceae bacterium]|nr:aldolase/citrate lyase family protein [Herpetosiphonaceae bacterium]